MYSTKKNVILSWMARLVLSIYIFSIAGYVVAYAESSNDVLNDLFPESINEQDYTSEENNITSEDISTDPVLQAIFPTSESSIVMSVDTVQYVENNKSNKLNELTFIDKDIIQVKRPPSKLDDYHVVSGNIYELNNPNVTSASSMKIYEVSGLTVHELEVILAEYGTSHLADDFIKAELQYNVNALLLIGIGMQESGKSFDSKMARTKNNIFGWQAYDSATHKARTFSSKEECIDFVASRIAALYASPDSKLYSTTLADMNKYYASDKAWSSKIAKHIDRINNKAKELNTMSVWNDVFGS